MRIRIADPHAPQVVGTRWSPNVVLRLRCPGELFESTLSLKKVRETIDRWLARLTPEEREAGRFAVYARVVSKAGGLRRVCLGEWTPGQPLEAFLETIRAKDAQVPVDPNSRRAFTREAWVDEEEFAPEADSADSEG